MFKLFEKQIWYKSDFIDIDCSTDFLNLVSNISAFRFKLTAGNSYHITLSLFPEEVSSDHKERWNTEEESSETESWASNKLSNVPRIEEEEGAWTVHRAA